MHWSEYCDTLAKFEFEVELRVLGESLREATDFGLDYPKMLLAVTVDFHFGAFHYRLNTFHWPLGWHLWPIQEMRLQSAAAFHF